MARPHHGRHGRQRRPARTPPTSSSTARRSPPSSRPVRPRRSGVTADAHDRRHRQVRRARAASTCTPTWSCPSAAPSASDTFETGTTAAAWGGVTTIVDFAVQRTGENVQEGLAEWHAQGRRQLRHRLRLPPDHRRRRRGVAEGDDVPRRQRGHHQLQAVHGLPRRLLQRRRPDPAGDADGGRERRDDHDARRERHRHRRPRRPGARPRRDRPEVPLRHPPGRARGRGHAPGDRAGQGRRQRAAVHRPHVGVARRSRRSPRPATPGATCSPRRARSTST